MAVSFGNISDESVLYNNSNSSVGLPEPYRAPRGVSGAPSSISSAAEKTNASAEPTHAVSAADLTTELVRKAVCKVLKVNMPILEDALDQALAGNFDLNALMGKAPKQVRETAEAIIGKVAKGDGTSADVVKNDVNNFMSNISKTATASPAAALALNIVQKNKPEVLKILAAAIDQLETKGTIDISLVDPLIPEALKPMWKGVKLSLQEQINANVDDESFANRIAGNPEIAQQIVSLAQELDPTNPLVPSNCCCKCLENVADGIVWFFKQIADGIVWLFHAITSCCRNSDQQKIEALIEGFKNLDTVIKNHDKNDPASGYTLEINKAINALPVEDAMKAQLRTLCHSNKATAKSLGEFINFDLAYNLNYVPILLAAKATLENPSSSADEIRKALTHGKLRNSDRRRLFFETGADGNPVNRLPVKGDIDAATRQELLGVFTNQVLKREGEHGTFDMTSYSSLLAEMNTSLEGASERLAKGTFDSDELE